MDCPKCGLISPESAGRCDCGYDFRTGQQGKPNMGPSVDAVGVLAAWDDRLIARLADTVITIAIALLGVFVLTPLAGTANVLAIALAGIYFLGADALWNGQSLGKRLAAIRVVHAANGRACSLGQSVVRNVCLWFMGWLDLVFISRGRQQRVGDLAAGTIVVRFRNAYRSTGSAEHQGGRDA